MSSILYRYAQLPEPAFKHDDLPRRWAVLVRDGVIARIEPCPLPGGSTAEAEADEIVDLNGALLLPGFVDAHAHVTDTGLLLAGVDCSAARSVTEILDAVAAAAAAAPGRPVLGHGWDELLLTGNRPPTAQELDNASGGAVVYLSRVDVHSAVVSGALADLAQLKELEGWDDSGRVERDAHHAARHATRFGMPQERRRELQLLALRHATAQGLIQVHEMSAPHIAPDEDLLDLLDLPASGEPDLPEIVAYRGELAADEAAVRGVLERFGGRLAGLAGDLMMDGSFGSRTAGLHTDYEDAPGHRGHLYADAGQVHDHLVACTRAGVQGGFHVIGDAAVAELVKGLRQAAWTLGDDAVAAATHRLEHVEGISDDDILTLADLDVIASVQPAFDATWGGYGQMYALRLGAWRSQGLNPFLTMLRSGVNLAFGSDSPVTPFAPWEGLRAALTHHNPAQRLDLRTAIEAHTIGGLRAARRPAPATIRVGEGDPATFVAWDSPGIRVAAASEHPSPLAALTEELKGGDAVPRLVPLRDSGPAA
ncbi:amidohydrolase family protein [Kineosporia sp. J2-2]|uniref:Amidohydrolase family protein n=1 Tax=Kineosporia corallincola TaxID=2835133 RepID=A0ABS5TLI3_9ACTN|nr:amidohydrolase family protein [Kineosporia corallincola]MBT0771961.1 amidohydrolase family protein [Kineosporia corallincola]